MHLHTVGSPLAWLGFLAFVAVMLALDLGVFHRHAHVIGLKEAAKWSALWIALALAFNVLVVYLYGTAHGLEFLTGYLIEKALALDNIFVIAVIFSYFAIPPAYQHRVLFWGILGALVMRAVFILAGGAFIQRFHWAMYVLGALLLATGIKLLWQRSTHYDPSQNPMFRLAKRFLPLTEHYNGAHFVVKQNGKRYLTPLFLALLVVEVTDVVFAVDSIPAIFAVTQDPFIVFTSNIFAILGLRSLYFLLAGVIDKFRYLKTGLAMVLLFVALKMLLVDVYKIPIGASLLMVAALIGGSIGLSLLRKTSKA